MTRIGQSLVIRNDHLETLRGCGGFYRCPKDLNGQRLGPLVGYAGKYTALDGTQKQWVGDVYVNFAMADEYPYILRHYAECICATEMFRSASCDIDVFCGAPLGGYGLAQMLGLVDDHRVIKAEKKVIALATKDQREQSEVVFARHQIEAGAGVVIVEDVCNNFSTTDQLIKLIEKLGGRVVAIACFLNRSLGFGKTYTPASSAISIPVISLVLMPIQEYRQDDPEVADDIANGNVVWKSKDEWLRLMAAMNSNI
jgi:adenine/guanine phosphoribosyltransferase-like PRPP-binding protein